MKWLRFQDQAPKEYEMVLVAEIEIDEPEDGPTCYIVRYLNGQLHQTWPAKEIDPLNDWMHIYYWMPLPADPEEEMVKEDIKGSLKNREQ